MDTESKTSCLKQKFTDIFGGEPEIYRAPGRVNLIGEHTDYNDGFVMPAAIDRYVWTAIKLRNDRKIRLHSLNYFETLEFDIDEPNAARKGDWSDYPRGVAVTLQNAGHNISGADVLISGEVPIGSGLSSSAALEISVGFALLDQARIRVDRTELAKLCQHAENEFVGMRCGLMDQFTACHGEAGKAVLLDCRSLDFELIDIPADASVVICNTMVKHKLASSEYNLRRADCEEGVRILSKSKPQIQALRDVTKDELDERRGELTEKIFWHCWHVVTENERVLKAAKAIAAGDLKTFGALMYESHRSLRDDFEVSSPELNLMVQIASMQDGVFGARMTGGGFGGCTVNLVRVDSVPNFIEAVSNEYAALTGIVPEVYACSPVSGVGQAPENKLVFAEI